jgi:hypothetical protein
MTVDKMSEGEMTLDKISVDNIPQLCSSMAAHPPIQPILPTAKVVEVIFLNV